MKFIWYCINVILIVLVLNFAGFSPSKMLANESWESSFGTILSKLEDVVNIGGTLNADYITESQLTRSYEKALKKLSNLEDIIMHYYDILHRRNFKSENDAFEKIDDALEKIDAALSELLDDIALILRSLEKPFLSKIANGDVNLRGTRRASIMILKHTDMNRKIVEGWQKVQALLDDLKSAATSLAMNYQRVEDFQEVRRRGALVEEGLFSQDVRTSENKTKDKLEI